MDNPTHSKRPGKNKKDRNPLTYTFDGQFLPRTPPDDDTTMQSSHSNSDSSKSSESGHSGRISSTSVATSFQLLANTMLRMELAELEMMKKRETARLETQRRRSEMENELTRMVLQTQSHIASFVSRKSLSRKRKNCSGPDGDPTASGTNM